MRRLLSPDRLMQAIRQCTQRFPITVGFIIALSLYLLTDTWADPFTKREEITATYYLLVGTLLTTVLQLWGEEVKSRRTRMTTNAIAHLILLADAAYIYATYENSGVEVFLAHASAITALALCLFILPFFKEKDDVASWNFSLRLLISGAASWLIGGVMCGGVCLLTMAIEELFGIDLSYKWETTWMILFLITLPLLLFVGRIPAGDGKFDRTPWVSTFLHKSIRYLFLPLLGCYLLVLYGYLAKIVLEWQLPDGWVSQLVSVLTFGCIAVVLGLYPSLKRGLSKTDGRIVRLLPLAILPLLVLMTVGIARRLGDYGITVKRLYLLALNVWFYAVCLGLYFSRARRVWWIATSFAAFFLATSALPINLTNYTRNWIYRHVEAAIKDSYKGRLPMSEEAYVDWIATLPTEKAEQVNSRLRYLYDDLDDKSKNTLVADSVNWWRIERHIKDEHAERSYYSNQSRENLFEIPLNKQYATVFVYSNVTETYRDTGQTLSVPLHKDGKPLDTLTVSIGDLRKWDAQADFAPRDIPCAHTGNRFIMTGFSLDNAQKEKAHSLTISGYYLVKE